MWTRQDDIRHDRFRPANYTLMKAALDEHNRPSAWIQRVVGPPLALDGVNIPYAIPNIGIEFVEEDPQVPTSAWRAVGASQNAFSVECFIDELAHAAGTDPLEYRLDLLTEEPRYTRVLTLAAEKADWKASSTYGRYQGIAFYYSFKSPVAQIAEVSVNNEGSILVHRVVCAIDCGIAVNPAQVVAQVEGAIVFGLSAALKGEITIENGRIQQSTFEDYPILTLAETPKIEVHIVPSTQPPCGVGEPGVPPIAPAVANAVFAATGKRLRSLPLRVS
jgi:isoquinoline 1-oxidoreductase beta subunit